MIILCGKAPKKKLKELLASLLRLLNAIHAGRRCLKMKKSIYLLEYPDVAIEYQKLKIDLSNKFQDDRIAYTKAKTKFIERITKKAKRYYLT